MRTALLWWQHCASKSAGVLNTAQHFNTNIQEEFPAKAEAKHHNITSKFWAKPSSNMVIWHFRCVNFVWKDYCGPSVLISSNVVEKIFQIRKRASCFILFSVNLDDNTKRYCLCWKYIVVLPSDRRLEVRAYQPFYLPRTAFSITSG